MNEIQSEICQFLNREQMVPVLSTNAPLELDSLTTVLLLAHLEARFPMKFENEDISLSNFSTVDAIADLVFRKMDLKKKGNS